MTRIDDIFSDIQTYIAANYSRQVKLVDFAAARGISQQDAQAALSYHARSWGKLLLDERMQHAREFLSYSGESIEAIAERVGYEPSQFVRTFKAEEGKEPEEYRQWMQTQRQQETSPPNGSPSS